MRALLLLALLIACSRAPSERDLFSEVIAPTAPGDPVVATADERPVHASEVLARRAARDGGPVLDDLLTEDLLAAEARRQGLHSDPEVRDAVKRALVQRLLIAEFEPRTRREDIPESVLRRGYQTNYWFFNRPEIRSFEHILVRLDPKRPQDAPRAEAFAGEILRLARARAGELASLRPEIERRAGALGLSILYENTKSTLQGLEKGFAEVLAATPAGQIGARVARSRYGLHVLRALQIEPAVSRPFEAVREEVRDRVYPEYRQMRFRQWLQELRAKHGARVAEAAHLLFRGAPAPKR
jgi:peptidyl-prolyl cis-trans isomerase C